MQRVERSRISPHGMQFVSTRIGDVPQRNPTTGLTPQQETFAQALVSGRTQADAYREAYPRSLNWQPGSVYARASQMAANGKVMARVRALHAQVSEIFAYTTASALAEADEALALARSRQNVIGMIASITLKAKLAGLLNNNIQVVTDPLDDLTHEEAKALLALLEQVEDAPPAAAP
jgi:hypothetical protein